MSESGLFNRHRNAHSALHQVGTDWACPFNQSWMRLWLPRRLLGPKRSLKSVTHSLPECDGVRAAGSASAYGQAPVAVATGHASRVPSSCSSTLGIIKGAI